LNSEHKPILIGRLQRYAMDHVYERRISLFHPAPPTGRRVTVIGAGPAGLSCAGELALRGHDVTVYDKRDLGGGLSTYGIIVLREPVPVALAEVAMIARLGVKFVTGMEVTEVASGAYAPDAVFIATGLGGSPGLGIPGEELIADGLAFIEQSKLRPESLQVGRNVVVIGAGNTAIDCATVAKRSGADKVTMVYRRTEREMTAYPHEYEFVRKEGVEFGFLAQPVTVLTENGRVCGLECLRMGLGLADSSGRPTPEAIPNSNFVISADMIVKAIGQQKPSIASALSLETDRGYIRVTESLETSAPGIYAGGDCIRAKGAASTVMAAQDGKIAAAAIHRRLVSHG
jgi:glutamate synthase (NADPH/NADH) small chain